MSQKEINRYDIIQRVVRKEITGAKAAKLLHLSERQIWRMKDSVQSLGAKGLVHGNRGKTSNHKLPESEREKIIKILHENYSDFGPTFASEKLDENHDIKHDPKTIRSIMISEKLWKSKSQRKKQKHRSWRKPKDHYGEMEQFDGSYHPWLEDRLLDKEGNPAELCLLASIDDASSRVTRAEFAEDEGVIPVFTFWKAYLEEHGKPLLIYLDKFSTYKMSQKVAKENHDTKTQFQRAMTELQIEPIFAHSPEAKGRVERLFKTLQDRLIKEMRLRNISSVGEANQFLKEEFLPAFNEKFQKEVAKKGDLHRALTKQDKKRLASILSRQEERVVRNDFTVSFKNTWYQLTKKQSVTVCKKDKVIMEEHVDGSIRIRHKTRNQHLNYEILTERRKQSSKNIPWVISATTNTKPNAQRVSQRPVYKPAADHPWRKSFRANAQRKIITQQKV